jgi:hypothetical protein
VRCVAPLPERYGAQETSRRFICRPVETPHPTPNLAELSALGDQRYAMQVFFDRATGGTASASLCSDATPEERVLPNAFGAWRFSFKRVSPKGGSVSLKTIIIAEDANIRQLQYTR